MIRKFAFKSLMADKLRCCCTIIAMILTSILFSSLFTTVIGIDKAYDYYNIKKTGTDYHFVVKDWALDSESTVNSIRDHGLVGSAGCRTFISYAMNKELNYNVEINYMDEEYAKHSFYGLTGGSMPTKANEVALDTLTIEALGAEKRVGAPVSIDIAVNGEAKTEDFVLSGWFNNNESYSVKVGQVLVSKEFKEQWASLHNGDEARPMDEVGVYLTATYDVEDEAAEILEEVGAGSEVDKVAVNPAYFVDSEGASIGTIAALAGGIAIIILIGYLIIHNIFYISAKRDAKLFGRLKTIGMSNKHLAKFVRTQACCLMIVAVPIGILCGYFMGNKILPFILMQTSMADVANDNVSLKSEMLGILIFSAAFVIITTFVSINGPIRMIKKLSPIESTRIELNGYKSQRKTTDGSKLHKFAFYNILRSKKSLILLVISIALPILLVIISFDALCSFDMDKYLSSMLYTDYTVASANYYKNEYLDFEGNVSALGEDIVNDIKNSDFYENGAVIYGDRATDYTEILNSSLLPDEEYGINVYGTDRFALNEKQFMESGIDLEAFENGSGLIEGCWVDSNGQIYPGTTLYKQGDTVTLKCQDGVTREYTVLGHMNVAMGTLTTKISDSSFMCELYACPEQYKLITNNENIMSMEFDVKKGCEEQARKYMEQLKDDMPFINYESKYSLAEDFASMRKIIRIISILLCTVLTWIAVMNLINVFVSSILVRKKEIAAMKSIGMTRSQLRKMFLWEIFYYNGASYVLAAALSIFLSISVLRWFVNEFSFMSFRVGWEIYPAVLFVILFIGVITVIVTEKKVSKANIVEELKTL